MQLCSVIAVVVFVAVGVCGQDDEALRECANLHRIAIQNIPNSKGSFENSKCLLKCTVADQLLSSDPINEGFACPLEPSGKCKAGVCVGGDSALVECTKLHNLDFKKLNNKGTDYSNDHCTLSCAIDGTVMATHAVHEGAACPANSRGVCIKGKCTTDGATPDPNSHEDTTQEPSNPDNTATDGPIGPTVPPTEIFSSVKIDEVEVKIKPGKFTEDIDHPYVDVCLSDTQSPDGNFCKQICYSNEVTSKTKEPSFDKSCAAMKAYSDESYLYLAVYAKVDERFVGDVHESVKTLFAQHYTKQSSGSVDFERQFPVQYFGKLVGHVALDVKIKFSKK